MKKSQDRLSGLSRRLGRLGLLACGLTVIGFAGALWWPFDLAAHFRVQYLAFLAGITLAFLVIRQWRWAGLFTLFAGVNLGAVAPLYVGERPMIDNDAPTYRAMLINVETSNDHYRFVEAAIEEADPDVVILEEVDERWLQELEGLKKSHPHSIVDPRPDNFGIALFSRLRLKDPQVLHLGPAGLPSVVTGFKGRDRFMIVATHPLPPTSARKVALRDRQLAALAKFVAKADQPLVLLGDLNVSPWSSRFRRLLEEARLQDASVGRGVQPTWPAGLLPLLIPIDHCLYSDGIAVVDKQVGRGIGSDHYPVIVDFQIRR